jgi:mono/diheme cytochrome c family protein
VNPVAWLKESSVMIRFVFCVAALALITVASAARADNAPPTTATAPDAKNGETVYHTVCQACHMEDAKGAVGAGHIPALAGNANLEASGYPLTIVLHGQKGMPPIGDYLTDAQVAAVINFVRSHFGNAYTDELSAADVKAAR